MRRKWIVWYAVALFLFYGFCAAISENSTGGTAMSQMRDVLPFTDSRYVLAAALLGSSALTVIGMHKKPSPSRIFWFLPQQMLLIAAAYGALEAIVLGQYADGAVYPRAFIAPDQIPAVFAVIGHGLAIIEGANE